MTLYQVTYNEDGTIASALALPPEPAKKRIMFVRADSEHEAKKLADALYSLAK